MLSAFQNIMVNESELIAKARVLLEALPYIQRFHDSIFVVKYGGSFMDSDDPEVRERVAADIVFLNSVGIKVVVVHGGGKAISRAMERSGIVPQWRNGIRVTDEKTIRIVESTLNNEINADICAMIARRNGDALGMPGNLVNLCEKMSARDDDGNAVDLGFVGEIKSVKTKLIKKALAEGKIPVISPIALDENDRPYNTNADAAASAVASALKARRLVFMSDVPGLLANPKDPSTLISTLRVHEVPELKRTGVISAGMIPKVDSAVRALQSGVRRVHFIDGRTPHSLLLEIFTDKGVGTEIIHPDVVLPGAPAEQP
ncbi:acetylglutamate kinase [Candidatus Spyradosoma sp. SGI.093]|uniref:acetylglutamate kinase n=1 Tax=Candidatus Spyradosoma sp. SGI.093 TaxID=3420583 RepID=UPI003D0722F5